LLLISPNIFSDARATAIIILCGNYLRSESLNWRDVMMQLSFKGFA
jgi:hypothetical protein